jgi:hypothetical protein
VLAFLNQGAFDVSFILNFNKRKFPAFISISGMILSIGLTAGAALASEKSDFLSTVNESISGQMIAHNMFRYVGKRVDLHCVVSSIPMREAFNADCGPADETDLIVIMHDASGLSTGQAIRVIGTVEEPQQGTSMMGAELNFPTVSARFME